MKGPYECKHPIYGAGHSQSPDVIVPVVPVMPDLTVTQVRAEPLLTDERQSDATRPPIVHKVKSWTKLFQAALDGIKTHDIRVLDRDYQVGDFLLLQEYDWGAKRYTGRDLLVEITYITCARVGGDPRTQRACAFSPACLHPDYGVLSIRHPRQPVRLMS